MFEWYQILYLLSCVERYGRKVIGFWECSELGFQNYFCYYYGILVVILFFWIFEEDLDKIKFILVLDFYDFK